MTKKRTPPKKAKKPPIKKRTSPRESPPIDDYLLAAEAAKAERAAARESAREAKQVAREAKREARDEARFIREAIKAEAEAAKAEKAAERAEIRAEYAAAKEAAKAERQAISEGLQQGPPDLSKSFVPQKIPPGLVETVSEIQKQQMTHQLSTLMGELDQAGIQAVPRIVHNRDGSVDAELRILTDVKPANLRKLLSDLDENLTPQPQTWLSLGFWLPPGPDEHKTGTLISRKTGLPMRGGKGSYMVQTHYYGAWDIARLVITGKGVLRKLAEHKVKEIESVILRINWNPNAKRPTRLG